MTDHLKRFTSWNSQDGTFICLMDHRNSRVYVRVGPDMGGGQWLEDAERAYMLVMKLRLQGAPVPHAAMQFLRKLSGHA